MAGLGEMPKDGWFLEVGFGGTLGMDPRGPSLIVSRGLEMLICSVYVWYDVSMVLINYSVTEMKYGANSTRHDQH